MRAPGPDEDGDGEKIEGSAQGMMVRLELGDEAHGRCYRLATWRGSEQGHGGNGDRGLLQLGGWR
jgi:hypothetical protein